MAPLSKEQRRLLERATLQYAEHLDDAAEWLAGRGLELEHARSNGLGVVRDPLPGHEHLKGRLSIPYLTDAGPVDMNFRCIEDHSCKEVGDPEHVKYRFPRGSKAKLYGVQSISWADEWIVFCEGEIDAMTWHSIGVPALAVSGAKKWQDWWTHIFEDFSRTYVAVDGDESGEWYWKKVSSEVSGAIKIGYPSGEDTNSLYLKRGKEYLLSRIKK